MKREIKFRGKSISGKWLYGVPVKTWWYGSETWRILEDGDIFGGDIQPLFDESIDPETIGQYTGLKDKNGKDIYFNSDVVQIETIDDFSGESNYIKGIVFMDYKLFKISLRGHEYFNFQYADSLEIIGNIHEERES